MIKNWAVLAYAETFAKQKRDLAALASGAQPAKSLATEEDENKRKLVGSASANTLIKGSVVGSEVGLVDEKNLVQKD